NPTWSEVPPGYRSDMKRRLPITRVANSWLVPMALEDVIETNALAVRSVGHRRHLVKQIPCIEVVTVLTDHVHSKSCPRYLGSGGSRWELLRHHGETPLRRPLAEQTHQTVVVLSRCAPHDQPVRHVPRGRKPHIP